MHSFKPQDKPLREVFSYMLHAISPRPIALVGTVNKNGKHNIAPFSFFNGFGSNPPTVGFSAATSARTKKRKDTYENIMQTKECTIQVVTYSIAGQTNLTSIENTETDEFIISGLTPIESDLIKAPRVKESPIQMECKLIDMVHLGEGGGAGNLALCEIIKFHIDETILENGKVNPYKLDVVGRNGGPYYTRANGDALFEINRPVSTQIIGYQGLPKLLLKSKILSGNDLSELANCDQLPSKHQAHSFIENHPQEIDASTNFIETWDLLLSEKSHHKLLSMLLNQISNPLEQPRHLEEIIKIAISNKDLNFARLLTALY
ncbi:hypothetical protein BVY03_02395 [bacterium K02(2017)]|nr:hypothetical protein BVY03_02395 [bacterium K02(2017)]